MTSAPAELVDPFAKILVSSYVGAAADARSFAAEWHCPPTQMQKVHTFRSIVQAQVNRSDHYTLHAEHSESGKVQVTDEDTHRSYVIRSKVMIDIDEAKKEQPRQLMLFETPGRSATSVLPEMLAYKFDRNGMMLWICSTRQVSPESHRLVPVGKLDPLGFWPFDDTTAPPPDGGGGGLFDQGTADPFDDLGDPDIDDLGEAGGL